MATQGATASAAMILTYFSYNYPVSAPEHCSLSVKNLKMYLRYIIKFLTLNVCASAFSRGGNNAIAMNFETLTLPSNTSWRCLIT